MGKRQRRPEPFSIEELEEIAQSPALQGFEKVLQYRPILVEPPYDRTVEDETSSTVEDEPTTTVEVCTTSTVEVSSASTVEDGAALSHSARQQQVQALWIAEGAGGVFTSSRVKRIQQAQDALTHVEEAVYDALWGPKKKDAEPYRLSQMGYTELANRSRVSKRSIQSVIDRLLEKKFILIETPPDISRRQSTVYRVLGYAAALKQMRDSGRNYVIRTGKGVFYAAPLTTRSYPVEPSSSSTVEPMLSSTVEDKTPSTVETAPTVTVEAGSTSTVEVASTDTSLGISEGTTSSGSPVAARIVKLMPIDDDAVSKLIVNCRRNDPQASEDEIGYCAETWIRENARNSTIRKPVAVMLTAVPKFFEPPATQIRHYRALKDREAEKRREEAEQTLQIARNLLNDPESSEDDREWAQSILAARAEY